MQSHLGGEFDGIKKNIEDDFEFQFIVVISQMDGKVIKRHQN